MRRRTQIRNLSLAAGDVVIASKRVLITEKEEEAAKWKLAAEVVAVHERKVAEKMELMAELRTDLDKDWNTLLSEIASWDESCAATSPAPPPRRDYRMFGQGGLGGVQVLMQC